MSEDVLQVRGVSVAFDGFLAVRDVDLDVASGAVHALIGPNGAGKTTLLDAVCGRVRSVGGRILVQGRGDISRVPEHRRARMGIARKFQTPSIFPGLTVAENLELAAAPPALAATLFAPLPGEREVRVAEVLDAIHLSGLARRPAGDLAHGQKQWLEIGMLLVRDPLLVLLDEPVAGMTARERAETAELVRAVARRATVLLVEHDMDFVRQVASSVTVMHEGRVLCEGSMAEVAADPRVISSYLGREAGRHAVG